MFDYLKIGIVIILVTVVGYFGYTYEANKTKVIKLGAEVIEKKVEIADLTNTAILVKKADAITENTNVLVAEKTNALNTKELVITTKVEKKVADIKLKYSDTLKLPEVASPEAQEISTVRINGLWETYCSGSPENPSCSKNE